MKRLFYLIGPPASGKTTLMQAALAGVPYRQCKYQKLAYLEYPKGVQLGVAREGFAGTDGLAMDVMPVALGWLFTCKCLNLVGEGDRLASDKFFKAAECAGWDVTVGLVYADTDTLMQRWRERGAKQDPKWVEGRITKAYRLADRWADEEWFFNSEDPLDDLVYKVRRHPAIANIRGQHATE